MEVYVTGIGCISSLGDNVTDNLKRLRKGQHGLSLATHFESKFSTSFYFGEIKRDNQSLIDELNLQANTGLTRSDLLAIKAFSEAIISSALTHEQLISPDTAFISASTVGGMCITDQLYRDANLLSDSVEYLASYSCAAHTLKIAELLGLKGLTNTINTACSSSANAIMYGSRLIQSGRAKRAIVGGVDSLAKYTVNGFNALQILSAEPCKPFDSERTGLNLGEAAAYLILESETEVKDKKILAKLTGYGNTNDAYHSSSMSDSGIGVKASINEALTKAKISNDLIDYINAHGTGTLNNDFVELAAFHSVFKKVPVYSSTKSYTGHTLGAAGALESIFSILSLMYQEIYPSLNFKNEMAPYKSAPLTILRKDRLENVMSNSYGFNGNCTSLIFQRA